MKIDDRTQNISALKENALSLISEFSSSPSHHVDLWFKRDAKDVNYSEIPYTEDVFFGDLKWGARRYDDSSAPHTMTGNFWFLSSKILAESTTIIHDKKIVCGSYSRSFEQIILHPSADKRFKSEYVCDRSARFWNEARFSQYSPGAVDEFSIYSYQGDLFISLDIGGNRPNSLSCGKWVFVCKNTSADLPLLNKSLCSGLGVDYKKSMNGISDKDKTTNHFLLFISNLQMILPIQ